MLMFITGKTTIIFALMIAIKKKILKGFSSNLNLDNMKMCSYIYTHIHIFM